MKLKLKTKMINISQKILEGQKKFVKILKKLENSIQNFIITDKYCVEGSRNSKNKLFEVLKISNKRKKFKRINIKL